MSDVLKQGAESILALIAAGNLDALFDPVVLELFKDISDRHPIEARRIEHALRRTRSLTEFTREARQHRYEEPQGPAPGARPQSDKPVITVGYNLRETVDAVEEVLAQREDVFCQGNALVGVVPGERGDVRVRPVSSSRLHELITDSAMLVEPGNRKSGPRPTQPSKILVDATLSRGHYSHVRRLLGVTTAPLPESGGGLRTAPGYDPDTAYFTAYSGPSVAVPPQPTRDDAIAAYKRLAALLTDFPFVTELGPVAWVAMVLTLLLRPRIAGPVVIFLVRANTMGTGKTLLCQIAAILVYGADLDVRPYSNDDREFAAAFTAILFEGAPAALYDNVVGSIGNANLDAATTSDRVKARRYGSNTDILELAVRTVIIATGNNVTPSGDLARRVILMELETSEERPDQRSDFEHGDLRSYVAQNRAAFLADAATIVRAYALAGSPATDASPIGSFGAWAREVRDPLLWLGLPDPVSTQDALHEEQNGPLRGLLTAWEAMFGKGSPRTLTQAITAINEAEATARQDQRTGGSYGSKLENVRDADKARVLLGALKEIGYTSQDGSMIALGRRFRQFENRRCDGKKFAKTLVLGTNAWMVVDADDTGVAPAVVAEPSTPTVAPEGAPKARNV